MKKNNANTSTPQPELALEPNGSFSMGLFLGVIGGALGMWMFHTKDGEAALEDLKKVWHEWSEDNEVPPQVAEKIEQTAHVVQEARSKFPKFRAKTTDPQS